LREDYAGKLSDKIDQHIYKLFTACINNSGDKYLNTPFGNVSNIITLFRSKISIASYSVQMKTAYNLLVHVRSLSSI